MAVSPRFCSSETCKGQAGAVHQGHTPSPSQSKQEGLLSSGHVPGEILLLDLHGPGEGVGGGP